ncbi:L,D-transpeptidase family protein [Streptomyces sp. NBC_00878]|uniref:L,D-transpeptidase family protein n=1 Tax=Streptomyces sp. NBC_00878 TaxID=2975854 RepID=UPI002256B306|nr:L,D-transpeptidase family protein [Streptomyces sp. NBC_00878]MCX4903029.1 L,D-transpeptidase family protein [Streptomyces sp. NBC_00878]
MITPTHGAVRRPVAVLAAALLLAGCGGGGAMTTADQQPGATPQGGSTGAPRVSMDVAPQQLPGLGPKTLAQVPQKTRQAVVVTGRGKNSPISTVVLYERTESGWQAGASWPAHNALKGWTDHHVLEDLRSPIGVYALTDAGGLLPDPGASLPYDQSSAFTIGGKGFEGEPLAGSFDYVIAINYNRKAGTTPLDWTRPLGADRGGGIWLHVDHEGPTHGCVSLRKEHMKALLRALDPDRDPVIVMGDAAALRR